MTTTQGEDPMTAFERVQGNAICTPSELAARDAVQSPEGAADAEESRPLRAVDSTVYCHAEMRLDGDRVLTVCQLPLGHREQDGTLHADGCTRWGHDDRPREKNDR